MKKEELFAMREYYQKKVDAIDVLLQTEDSEPVSNGIHPKRSLPPPPHFSPIKRPKLLIEAVDEATQAMKGEFTSAGVISYLKWKYPEMEKLETKTVSGPLAALAKRNKIEFLTRGSGNTPNIYIRSRSDSHKPTLRGEDLVAKSTS